MPELYADPHNEIVIIYVPNTAGQLLYMKAIREEIDKMIGESSEGKDVPRFIVLPHGARLEILNIKPEPEPDNA